MRRRRSAKPVLDSAGDLYVGVDLGGTNLRAGLVDGAGRLDGDLEKVATLAAEGPEAVMRRMSELVKRLLGRPSAGKRVRAVGVGSPGPLDTRSGRVLYTPNLPGFNDFPVTPVLEAAVGLPCFLENDANSACYGEFWVGAGKGAQDMVILTLGTGVGGGVILDGRLRRGLHDTAGHLGHIVVHPAGEPCGCGGRGCLEQYASATAVVRNARRMLEEAGRRELAGRPLAEISAKEVTEAAAAGDNCCRRAVTIAAEALGWALVTIANALDPEVAVIGGGMAQAGSLLLASAEQIVRRNALFPPREHVRITTALLGDAAGIIGAAGCARNRFATSR